MMKTNGVEISVAGVVVEMVRAQLSGVFFSSFFFSYIMCYDFSTNWGIKTTWSASYCKGKPRSPGYIPPCTTEKAINPSPSSVGPTGPQPRKIRNPTLTI